MSSARRLRLLNVAASIDPAAGGVSESIVRLSRAVIDLGHDVDTVSVDDPASPWRAGLTVPAHLKGPVTGPLEYSRDFEQWLNAHAADYDALIAHGLWRYNSAATRKAARAAGKPYFVFPHGMLDPWFKRYYPLKHLKKTLYWWTKEYATLRDARAVLFTCEEEKRLARESFTPYRVTERVVPLGTGSPPENIDDQRRAYAEKFPELQGKRVILFLGRLHEKKGCDLLLEAFLQLLQSRSADSRTGLHLMMAGPTAHPDYLARLREIAGQCEALAPGSVSFPGMLSGDLKWGTLRGAEVFVLPSHQENFGIAVVEALACGTPVLISRPVNIWREIETANAGFVEEDTADGTLRLLNRWLDLGEGDRVLMAGRAITAFREQFEIGRTAAALIDTINSFDPSFIPTHNSPAR